LGSWSGAACGEYVLHLDESLENFFLRSLVFVFLPCFSFVDGGGGMRWIIFCLFVAACCAYHLLPLFSFLGGFTFRDFGLSSVCCFFVVVVILSDALLLGRDQWRKDLRCFSLSFYEVGN